jgi:hypothetical protein
MEYEEVASGKHETATENQEEASRISRAGEATTPSLGGGFSTNKGSHTAAYPRGRISLLQENEKSSEDRLAEP